MFYSFLYLNPRFVTSVLIVFSLCFDFYLIPTTGLIQETRNLMSLHVNLLLFNASSIEFSFVFTYFGSKCVLTVVL